MHTDNFKAVLKSLGSLFLLITLSSCVVKDMGQTVEQTVKGDYFLQTDQSKRGRESFRLEVEENPESALAHYYYGRFLLQEKENMLALEHLARARDLEPGKADYQFWSGVAFGVNGHIKREEENYRTALKIEKNHLQSLIYLGHNQFAQKKYSEALQLYQQALDIWPSSPSALYNRALILHLLGRTPEERIAWLDYLEQYPSGPKARRAADYLNMAGDFNFRNQTLGATTVTVEKIRFVPFTADLAEASYASLSLIGEVYQDMSKENTLQIVVFQKNNKELAKKRALSIKQFLYLEFPQIDNRPIGVSWFAEPQQLIIRDRNLLIDEAVSFFVTR
jgi:tetratricopeptide (TPR) repeat protein